MHTDAVIKTAVLYITNLMHINAFSMAKDENGFCLPSPHVSDKENQNVRNLIEGAQDQTILFMTDSHYYSYCMMTVSDRVVFLGPYLEVKGSRRGDVVREYEYKAQTEAERQGYRSMVLLTREEVKAAAHTLFLSVCGSTEQIKETAVNLGTYSQGDWYEEEKEGREINIDAENARILSAHYMKQIEKGDYLSAAAAYQKIMKELPRYRKFILIHTIEGMSTLRTLTTLAAQQAGVSQAMIQNVMEDFKGKARRVTSRDEAVEICCHMISDICELVRNCRLQSYSKDIRRVVEYIDSHLKETLSVTEIAEKAGLTPNRLSTKFHKETGVTIMAYVNRERLKEAAGLLELSQLPVQEIGTRVGYLDSNYFARCFKKAYGITPTEYRRSRYRKGSCS